METFPRSHLETSFQVYKHFGLTGNRTPVAWTEIQSANHYTTDPRLTIPYVFIFYRVMFGPDLVMLGPDEQFTVLSISGGKPKCPNVIKALCLLLGPDFCTDIVVVETSDHARLSLQLSYNW